MQTHEFSCNNCNYFIKTTDPRPYYMEGNKKILYESYAEAAAGPINGLMADIYCSSCDKQKKYVIAKYERPLAHVSEIWTSSISRKTQLICHKCKKPIYWILPSDSIKCPRCKKGKFESFEYLDDFNEYHPVPPTNSPLRVKQNGKTIHVPKPTIIIDSAEQLGYEFSRFNNWFAGTIRKRLPIGDYTIQGMEKEIAVERKTLSDLVSSIIQRRVDFISKCEKMSELRKKCIVIETSLSSLKSPYDESNAHPNAVLGSLIAAQERWNIPIYFLDNDLLAEEFVASMLSKYHAYRWLEDNGFERCLIEGDI